MTYSLYLPPGHLRGLRAHSTEEKLMATNAATKNITEAIITEQLQFKAQKAESKVGKKVLKRKKEKKSVMIREI